MPSRRKPPPGGGQTAGVPHLTQKSEQLAQATQMLAMRLFEGKTVQAIADEMGVDRVTVSRRLRLARKEGVPEEARTIFIREMLPAAMAVVMESLKSTDEKIRNASAWKLINGLEAMKLPEDEREARKAGAGDDDTYEVWRERVKITRASVERAAVPIRRENPVIDIPSPVQAADPADDAAEGGE